MIPNLASMLAGSLSGIYGRILVFGVDLEHIGIELAQGLEVEQIRD